MAMDYPHDKCIDELFEAQVEKSPDAIAVVFEDKQLTYQNLNQRANQLAHYLRKLGVGPETFVGLCVERSLEMIVGLLGVLKAGGAYVPLDPGYPKERLAFMLEETQAPVLLTQWGLIGKLSGHCARVVYLDTDWDEVARESKHNPRHQSTAENLAYVIYTSGSTGKPKGVMIKHGGLTNYLNYCLTTYPLKEGRGSVVHSTIAFDATITALFAPLLTGLALYLLPQTDDVEALATILRRERDFSLIKITPAHLAMLSQQIPSAEVKGLTHAFVIGGENLIREQITFWQKYAPDTLLFNEYGPTETVVGCIVYEASKWQGQGSVPIGRPIPNTVAYVLDQHLRPVPIEVRGELYLGGAGVGRGYLRRPELTAERFIANPFSDGPESRLYKTGDLARYLPDGNIEFLGRIDDQVKIRGYRIELGEIEAALIRYPPVNEAVVLAREDIAEDRRLVAYIVLKPSVLSTRREIRSFLKETLPEYMVPSAFVFLDSLPLTPNGKVDRKSLPVPDRAGVGHTSEIVSPRNEVERRLAKIWKECLGVSSLGIQDDFFELGGNSISAVRLLTRVEKEFGRSVSLATLFEGPTVEKLADLLRHGGKTLKWNWLVPLQPVGSLPPVFLVHASRELAQQIGTDHPIYGLRPHGLDGRRAPLRVEEMAVDYVTEVRMVQPKGPYIIGGYSFGGVVAFEMAQQLRRQGQEVKLLVLLDPISARSSSATASVTRFDKTVRYSAKLSSLGIRRAITHEEEAVMWRLNSVKHWVKILACRSILCVRQRLPVGLRSIYFIEVGCLAARNYVPRVYHGSAVLLSTRKAAQNLSFDWRQLVIGKLETYEMPGRHLDAIQGSLVTTWAAQLRACLQNV
jgi:amino acid adenylation domain-containing protein